MNPIRSLDERTQLLVDDVSIALQRHGVMRAVQLLVVYLATFIAWPVAEAYYVLDGRGFTRGTGYALFGAFALGYLSWVMYRRERESEEAAHERGEIVIFTEHMPRFVTVWLRLACVVAIFASPFLFDRATTSFECAFALLYTYLIVSPVHPPPPPESELDFCPQRGAP